MKSKKNGFRLREQLVLQSMIVPAAIVVFIFSYIPMYGITIAFKDFSVAQGIFEAPWAGIKYFKEFLTDPNIWNVFRNTLVLNVVGTIICFPAPILLAICINELTPGRFKKAAQTISYLPHFLSWVIFAGLILEMLRPGGIASSFSVAVGLSEEPINFLAKGEWFYGIFICANLIKGLGYGSIIYVAALSGVDQEIYEAATMDGCNRMQKIWYISLPSILGTVMIMLVLQIGSILNTGIEQILMFQNPLNMSFSETLDTYVYKVGIAQGRFSYSTAVGLLKSIVSVVLLVGANWTSNKLTEKSLF